MSKSHLVHKNVGSLNINYDDITSSNGNLFVDTIPVAGSGSGIQYNTVGSNYNLDNKPLGCLITNATTTSTTITGLYVTNDADVLSNKFTINGTEPLGHSSGTLISTLAGTSGMYLGDDNISLYNTNNDTGSICFDSHQVFFYPTLSSVSGTSIIDGTLLNSINLNVNNTCTLANTLLSGPLFYNTTIPNASQTGGNTSTITTNHGQFGTLTIPNCTLATMGSLEFQVVNNTSNQNPVMLSITDYTGSQGIPSAYVKSVTGDTFQVIVNNSHNTDPLNGNLILAYNILYQTSTS